ncbi:hypothetical protein MTO96_019738 [Rhipicephalus appendiculatus]
MTNWDPMNYLHEEPTPQCLLRVKKDIAEFNAEPPPNLFISPEESDITQVHVLMLGAPGSPYEGGIFPILHQVCVTTLGTGGGPCDWSPAQSLSSTLVSIQSLVSNNDFSVAYVQYETMRVAVCDQVEAALGEDAKCPPAFRKIILESFLESYSKYEDAVKARIPQTGFKLKDLFPTSVNRAEEYEKLLTRLKSLKDKIQKKKEADAAAAAAAENEAEAAAAENENK